MYLQTQYYCDVFKSWKKVARLYIKNFACKGEINLKVSSAFLTSDQACPSANIYLDFI